MEKGYAHFFSGALHARLNATTELVDAGPEPIVSHFPGFPLPAGIDAAVDWGDGSAYVFSGTTVGQWDLETHTPFADTASLADWPDFPFPYGIDDAINWRDGSVYFFRGNQCARTYVDERPNRPPGPIADELPHFPYFNGIDAAVEWWHGKAYFFSGDSYCRYDMATSTLDLHARPIPAGWGSLVAAVTGTFGPIVQAALYRRRRVVARQDWDAAPATQALAPIDVASRTELTVHWQGEPTIPDSFQAVRNVQAGHLAKGAPDVRYNFLVDQYGNTFEGRGRDVNGGHTQSSARNARAIAVCLLGTEPPTPQAKWAIRRLWRECSDAAGHELEPAPHQPTGGDSACPGAALRTWVDSGMLLA